MSDEPMADSMTIVIHLPQPLHKVGALLRALADQWPDARFVNGLTRLDIPAETMEQGFRR